jgi:hypothetical protein
MSDISMQRSSTATIVLTTTLGGAVHSLSGIQALSFTAKNNKSDTTAVISKSLGSGLTVTDAANGIAVLTIDPADTSSLTCDPDVLWWDLIVKDATDAVYTLNSGRMIIAAPVGAITSTTVRKMVVGADTLNNWADEAALTLVAGIDVSDTMNLWRDSVMLAQFDALVIEDTLGNSMVDSLQIGIGLAVGDTLSMSDAAVVVMM